MCTAEATTDHDYLVWRDDIAMIGVPNDAPAIPLVAFLMPRRHADLADLTPEEAGHLGELLVHVEQAACDVLDVPRLHVIRYGDGQEHLHWWLMGRPTGALQLRGSFLSLWDDLLPQMSRREVRDNLDLVCGRLVELAGGTLLGSPGGG
jgi:diadenosine tetraphosphate (Ap4A) HIT family hydrolase